MNQNPRVGILQTLPRAVNLETLLSRLNQFANHLYGPFLNAGLRFLQFGDAQYRGHNAIIHIRPIIQHCGLPKLSGRPPLGGTIWDHAANGKLVMVWGFGADGRHAGASVVSQITGDALGLVRVAASPLLWWSVLIHLERAR